MNKFSPDGRNLGGRSQIELLQEKHLLALINSNAHINIKPPKPHVDTGRAFKPKIDYSEINETYRRVKALKAGFSDMREPKSHQLRDQLKRKNKVSQDVSDKDHYNNINSLMRNICKIESRSQQKIKQLRATQKLHSIASSMKDQARVGKKEWDSRLRHPLEAQWKAQRPKSAHSKSSFIESNLMTVDSRSHKNQTKQQEIVFNKNDNASFDLGLNDDDMFIKQDSTMLEPNLGSQYQSIIDKRSGGKMNIVIPVISDKEKMATIKRKIYDTILNYKVQ